MILITGGSGFLGAALARRLIESGERVRNLDITAPPETLQGCEFFQGDIRDARRVEEACRGCSAVFHSVGIMPQARAPRAVMQAVNVGGTRNVLDGAVKNGVTRVIFASSAEVYGFPERIPIPEDSRKAPIGEYGRNKLEAEGMCLDDMKHHGLETVILRPSTLIGPGITEPLFLRFLGLASRDKPLFYLSPGTSLFQMTSLSDCVEACIRAWKTPGIGGEAFNIGADGTLPMKEQIMELKARAGIRSRVFPLPAGPVKLAMRLLHPLGLSPLEPDHFHLADVDYVMDCNKAKTLLGWAPAKTNLDMIAEAFDWYKNTRQRGAG